MGVAFVIIDGFLVKIIQRIRIEVYSLSCAFQLPTNLFLHYFSTTHHRSVFWFDYTCACTQDVLSVTRVYVTLPIVLAQQQYGIQEDIVFV